MQLIPCPWCGPRDEVEFHYGGQAHVPYPEDPAGPGRRGVGALPLLPGQPQGRLRRALVPLGRLPPLVQRRPRHRHPRGPRGLPHRRAEAGDRMSGAMRLPTGGRVDRAVDLSFTFDGATYTGHPGDTLASALLANGVHQVATSIRLGRPRGIMAAGPEDPNALVQIEAPFPEPMLTATTVELYDGLVATGLPGQGRLAAEPDPARYDAMNVHCEVLVVGAGPAGLSAALTAARSGVRVVLLDDQPEAGGSLLGTAERIDGRPALEWVAAAVAELATFPEVRVLQRTTAFGFYDDGFVLALERRTDHLGLAAPAHLSRQRVWRLRARQVVAGHRRARAPGRVRGQRPSGHHARRQRPHLPAPLRRAVRPPGRGVHDQRQRLRGGRRPQRRRGRGGRRRRRPGAGARALGPGVRAARDRGARRAGGHRHERDVARHPGARRRAGRRPARGPHRHRLRPAPGLGRLEPRRAPLQPGPRPAVVRRLDRGVPARHRRGRGRRGRLGAGAVHAGGVPRATVPPWPGRP